MKFLPSLHQITVLFSLCAPQVAGVLLLMPVTLTASPGIAPDEPGFVGKSAKPAASVFAQTIPNQAPAPGPAPEGMVWIPGGEFSMGCLAPSEGHCTTATMNSVKDSQPIHRVYADGFWMDTTDVTNEEFDKFVRATGYKTIAEIASTQEQFPPDGYGLFDMAGNVWQWCSDWYRPDTYARLKLAGGDAVVRNPRGPSASYSPGDDQPQRVHRGGSFLCTDQYCTRYLMGTPGKGDIDTASNNLGFRCVEDPGPAGKESAAK